MVRSDILGGIKEAINRGANLKQAMASLYNAGYPQKEIEQAASAYQKEQWLIKLRQSQFVQGQNSSGKIPQKIYSPKQIIPKKNLQSKPILKKFKPLPSHPSFMSSHKPTNKPVFRIPSNKPLNKPVVQINNPPVKSFPVKKVSNYEENKKGTSHMLVLSLLIFNQLILLAVFIGLILFSSEVTSFINNLF